MTSSSCIHAWNFGPGVLSRVKHFDGPEMIESIGSSFMKACPKEQDQNKIYKRKKDADIIHLVSPKLL